jgi:GH15 family glucan-1,4-alpha-glucosidase
VISTLRLAQYYIAKARSREELALALPVLEWACPRARPNGVLAEQFHPVAGEPLSVSPLTWSHSTVVAAVQDYVAKYKSL